MAENKATTESPRRRLPLFSARHEKCEPSFFLEAGAGPRARSRPTGSPQIGTRRRDPKKASPLRPPRRLPTPPQVRKATSPGCRQVDLAKGLARGLGEEDAGRESRQARPQAGEPQGSGRSLHPGDLGSVDPQAHADRHHPAPRRGRYRLLHGEPDRQRDDIDAGHRLPCVRDARRRDAVRRVPQASTTSRTCTTRSPRTATGSKGSSSWTRGSGRRRTTRACSVEVEKWLKRVLRSTTFDVEDVELKGTPLVVSWGSNGEAGEERHLRLPGEDAEGLASFRRVGVHDAHDGARAAEAAGAVPRPGTGAGTGGRNRLSARSSRVRSRGRWSIPRSSASWNRSPGSCWRRSRRKSEDRREPWSSPRISRWRLPIIRGCTLHPNPDGSMPVARIKGLWDAAYAAGDTTPGVQLPPVRGDPQHAFGHGAAGVGRTRPTASARRASGGRARS